MSSLTRDFGNGGWSAGCEGAPPPLHVYDHESEAAAWAPLPRPRIFPQHGGPQLIRIPVVAPYGDDPLDRSMQTLPRRQSTGMLSRLMMGEGPAPAAEGVRQP